MPKPTLQNRRHFKTYVRYYKNKFTSVIQDATIDDINGILSEKTSGISTTTPIKFIIFDNYDILDVTSLKDNGDYIYLPALPYDEVTLRVNNIDYDFSFPSTDDGGIIYNGTTYQLNDTLNLPGIGITVNGLGGALLSLSPGLPVPTYSVGVGTTTINEGETISFTIETLNVGSGTTLYYEIVPTNLDTPIVGTGISTSDFLDSSLTGSFNIVGTGATTGIATIAKTLINDFNAIEGNETFVLTILKDSQTIVAISTTITVINQGIPSFNIGVSTITANEGDSVEFIINFENAIGIGKTYYFTTIGDVSSQDFSDNSLSGLINIVDISPSTGIATIIRTLSEDLSIIGTEGIESFQLEVREGSTSGTVVATSSTIVINDTSFASYTIEESSLSVSEGESFTITLNTIGIPNGTTLYYTSTNSDDIFPPSGSIVVGEGTTSFTLNVLEDLLVEPEETFQIQVRTDSISGNVVGSSSTISIINTTSFLVTESISSINEGENVTFTVTSTGVPDGSTLYYTASSSEDISPYSGSFVINNNSGSFSINAINDLNVESDESFNVQIRTGSTSGGIVTTSNNITIADVPYALSISSDLTVTEGNAINFTINTTGIPDSTTLYFTISGMSTEDIPIQSGSFTITNNTGSISLLPINDLVVDDNESFTLQIRSGSLTGTVIATSVPILVKDNPYTITVTPSSTSIIESTSGSTSTITFNIATTNISTGTTLKAKIVSVSGTIDASDFSPASLERSFTVTGSSISLSWDLVRDAKTEGNEQFRLQILDNSNNILLNSPIVTILDGSYIGSRYDGKIHGPIRVNRDNGNSADISDWFKLCNLDSLPEGSKIALFIDNSGSMGYSTVQASLNLFLEKINSRNMEIIVVTNNREDWINPFNTILD